MNKPKVHVWDWLDKDKYGPINEIVELEISPEHKDLPKNMRDYSAIIFHYYNPRECNPLIKDANNTNKPVIFFRQPDGNYYKIRSSLLQKNLFSKNIRKIRDMDSLADIIKRLL